MNISLSADARRTLALLILAGVLASAWSFVIWPLIELSRDRQADIVSLSGELHRLDTIAARKPELARRAQALHAQLAADRGLWASSSAPALAASVQNRVRAVVSASHGRVISASEASEASEHGFHKITVNFRIKGTLGTIQKTLATIENTNPSLFVERFTISAPASQRRDRPPSLELDLRVAGYMRSPPS